MIKLYLSKLSSEEHPHDCALRLLDLALRENCGAPLSDFQIKKTPSGKPYFADCGTKFNLSHSGDYAAAVISDRETGVDIERIKPVSARVIARYLKHIITGTSDEDVIEAWCRRESYGKFTSEGFLRADFAQPHHIEILKIIPGYIIATCAEEKFEIEIKII